METSNIISHREIKAALRSFTLSGGIVRRLPRQPIPRRSDSFPSAQPVWLSHTEAAYLFNHFGIDIAARA